MPDKPQRTPRALAVFGALLSCALMLWYAHEEFIPNLVKDTSMLGHDAYRYHLYAQRHAHDPVLDILSAVRDREPFAQMGYPVLLALLYRLTTPDALVGCLFNWGLWLVAGILLAPLAKPEESAVSDVPFLFLWLLFPDGIDWSGTTSKETPVVLATACALRICASRKPLWTQTIVCAGLAFLIYPVRSATVPLIALPLLMSYQARGRTVHRRWYGSVLLALVVLLSLYVAGAGTTEDGESDNPLASVGYDQLISGPAADDLTDVSLLYRSGSSDRLVDSAWVPIRGLANIVCPIYLNPSKMLLPDKVRWLSAALCVLALVAVGLRIVDRRTWTRDAALCFAVLALGAMLLGLSGMIHPRYRSLVVAALLPLGLRSVLEENAERGFGRLLFWAVGLPVIATILYQLFRLSS